MKHVPESIYKLDNFEFIVAAYRLVLEREPDLEGSVNYLKLMHQGVAKEEILLALYDSAERHLHGRPTIKGMGFLEAKVYAVRRSGPRLLKSLVKLHWNHSCCASENERANKSTENTSNKDEHFFLSLLPDRVGETVIRSSGADLTNYTRDTPSHDFSSFSQILRILREVNHISVCTNEPKLQVTEILEQAKTKHLISFDLWDTLIRRRCHPDAVKLSSARHLLTEYYTQLLPAFRKLTALLHARLQAEEREGIIHGGEYLFSRAAALYVDSVVEHGTPARQRAKMRDSLLKYELAVEKSCSFVDTQGLLFVRSLPDHNKVITSDFYHDCEFLGELLSHHKIEREFVRIYSSADHRKNKRQGHLFDVVRESFNLSPDQILHIGDNPHSDVAAAKSKGISAIHYEDTQFLSWKQKHAELFDRVASTESPALDEILLWKSFTLKSDVVSPNATLQKWGDELDCRSLGRLLAPLAVGYILFIIEEAKRVGVDKIFFFTREGIFLQKIYQLVVECDPYITSYPASLLLEVSRVATFAASLSRFDCSEFMRVWNMYSTQSPSSFMKTCGVPRDYGIELFHSSGLEYDTPVNYPWKNAGFAKTIESKRFQKFMRNHTAQRRKELESYLVGRGFPTSPGRPAFTVDIGWRGTIQDNIAHVSKAHVFGTYLALFRFLNKQPANESKVAYLFDLNTDPYRLEPRDITPWEMLFNSPGGSVTGYELGSNHSITVKKRVENSEEDVHARFIDSLQSGILESIPHVVAHVRENALTSATVRPTALKLFETLLSDPPKVFAEAYFSLNHNEVFGTGTIADKTEELEAIGQESQFAEHKLVVGKVRRSLACSRWPHGLLKTDAFEKAFEQLPILEQVQLPPITFDSIHGPTRPGRIAFFIPPAIRGSGGIRTMCNFARGLATYGHEVFIYLEREGDGVAVIHDMLQGARVHVNVGWVNFVPFDAAIATLAHSAPFVAALPHADHKFYFVQDFEAAFNPLSDSYVIGENSFTYGLTHLTIGRWLSHLIPTQYAQPAFPAGLGADTSIYRPLLAQKYTKPAIAFLYQPDKFRRAPNLGIQALSLVKKQHPETTIYLYGHDQRINLDFSTEQLGLISDLNEINELYNKCPIGLCISLSNPSRIPFEMMAAGCVPVDVYRYNNLFDYPAGTTLLAHQTPASLAKAICSLIEDPVALKTRRAECIRYAASRTLDWEVDTLVNTLHAKMRGLDLPTQTSNPLYGASPVIALNKPDSGSVEFCQTQAKQAGIAWHLSNIPHEVSPLRTIHNS